MRGGRDVQATAVAAKASATRIGRMVIADANAIARSPARVSCTLRVFCSEMSTLHPIAAIALLAVSVGVAAACTDAGGTSNGGDIVIPPPPPSPMSAMDGGTVTWTKLYDKFFGPGGKANCALQPICHGSASGDGAQASGYICGTTRDQCYAGITAQGSIVPTGGATDPTTTRLYQILRKAPPPDPGLRMPLQPDTVYFTQSDLDLIAAWIAAGAPND
jgi:hypothetical protein